jgi:hypothetical protein
MMRCNPRGRNEKVDTIKESGDTSCAVNGHNFTAKLIGKFSVI